jgi:hypothetical protein
MRGIACVSRLNTLGVQKMTSLTPNWKSRVKILAQNQSARIEAMFHGLTGPR